MSETDHVLVARAKAGDRTAFEALVDRHARPIYGMIYRMVRGQREEAEDLTQEVLLRAFQALPSFRGDSQFSTWLHRIAVNRTLNRLQKKSIPARSIHDVAPDRPDLELELPDQRHRPDRQAERQELKGVLERAIDHLSDSLRAVFVLREIEGLSHESIASILGVQSQAVRVRLHRAKKELIKMLTPYLEGVR
ncbi:MAG: sigma-70 family RNA polymerase sigma factor [Armatimonadetes bacterium]|nr:sigma-70 family RNA polymerase sigma factor [Armatimonadota bacterium]